MVTFFGAMGFASFAFAFAFAFASFLGRPTGFFLAKGNRSVRGLEGYFLWGVLCLLLCPLFLGLFLQLLLQLLLQLFLLHKLLHRVHLGGLGHLKLQIYFSGRDREKEL